MCRVEGAMQCNTVDQKIPAAGPEFKTLKLEWPPDSLTTAMWVEQLSMVADTDKDESCAV